jgi:hypothetical protein
MVDLQLEYTFEIDDVSTDIEVMGEFTDIHTEEYVKEVISEFRGTHWFNEGNRTEGVITFEVDKITITWKTINMYTEDGDLFSEEEDYSRVIER